MAFQKQVYKTSMQPFRRINEDGTESYNTNVMPIDTKNKIILHKNDTCDILFEKKRLTWSQWDELKEGMAEAERLWRHG